jgi:putative transposase
LCVARRIGTLLRMARHARGELPAGTYHVTTRSGGPIPIFLDDNDSTRLAMLLIRALRKAGLVCRAFCFMPTHYHLLLDVPADALQAAMHRLNGFYARGFNLRHGRKGHLFGERYYCRLVKSDEHMIELLRYIARNPVEAGLCEKPSDWYWSSYRGCIELDDGFPFVDSTLLRSYFGENRARATELIREFVEGQEPTTIATWV